MYAAVMHETGGPEVLGYEELPDPIAGPGEILIDVEVISIEGGDLLHRAGDAPGIAVPGGSHVVGYQAAGVVAGLGEGVEGFSLGDRVTSVGMDGSHATKRVTLAGATWKIPESLSSEAAACVPIPFGTAHDALFEFGRLEPGQTVLVQAGGSGVGLAAIQMAKAAGATVLATASSESKLARLEAFGLDHGINYSTGPFSDEVRRLSGGGGADVIVDTVGGDVLRGSLDCLAYRGRCVMIGQAGRQRAEPVDISSMAGQNQSLMSYFLGAELFLSERPHALIAQLLEQVADGELQVEIDRSFPLAEAELAHRYIEDRLSFGRVLLLPV